MKFWAEEESEKNQNVYVCVYTTNEWVIRKDQEQIETSNNTHPYQLSLSSLGADNSTADGGGDSGSNLSMATLPLMLIATSSWARSGEGTEPNSDPGSREKGDRSDEGNNESGLW